MSAPATVFLVWGVNLGRPGEQQETLVQVHATHDGQQAAMEAAKRKDGRVEIDGRVFDYLEPDARQVIA